MNKLWYSHNGILPGIKKKLIIHATTWMNVRCIMLNERSQNQKAIKSIIPFIGLPRENKSKDGEHINGR